MNLFKFIPICFLFLLSTCQKQNFDLHATLLQNDKLAAILKEAPKRNLQIMLTEIKRDGQEVKFIEHSCHHKPDQYFYPASTIKLPLSLLALEYCAINNKLSSDLPFKTSTDSSYTTIRKEIEKIFAVSDNAAFNRLYELLGPDYVNKSMQEKGIANFRLSHRLSTPKAADRATGNCTFLVSDTQIYTNDSILNNAISPIQLKNTKMGKGYYKADSLIAEPFDFSLKNQYSLRAQHETIKRLFFPNTYPADQRFVLTKEDKKWLQKTMHQVPRSLGYTEEDYPDGYVKFFLFGDTKNRIPEHIKIHNKVGYAYGHLTDTAYIIDEKTGLEYILTATILVNANQVFNDDLYEYDDIGIPFLAELGRSIHYTLNQRK